MDIHSVVEAAHGELDRKETMKHFVVIANAYKDRDFALTNKIVAYIEQKGGTAKGLMSNVEAISDNEFELEDIPQDTQCILVLGGDGTLIRAATRVETLEIPLMGVNLGTLGYLCEVEEATVFDAIDSLMADKYMTEDRIMLTGHKRGSETSRVALNDIVIHRKGNLQILSLNVYVNGEFLNNYRRWHHCCDSNGLYRLQYVGGRSDCGSEGRYDTAYTEQCSQSYVKEHCAFRR